jgi:hypothetical protein
VKNSEEIETPQLNIERDPLMLLIIVVVSVGLVISDYLLFKAFNPWGFFVLLPASILSFQALWLLLHPFALVFDNRFEIKHSLFSNKMHHFIDIKKLSVAKDGKLYITYKDDEVEPLKLFGIRKSHIELLKSEIEKRITT